MTVRVRKTLLTVERVLREGGTDCAPLKRALTAAVFQNAALGTDDLSALVEAGATLGAELSVMAVEAIGPVRAYGKAAIVGLSGEVEHGAAVLHPKLGAPMRAAIGGGKALIPSTAKVAAAGVSIDVPLGHKDDPWSFDEIETLPIAVHDSPRPDEILLVIAFSEGGRPRPRLPKS
ncbi:MAG: amino acid synthesis family protein [Pseudomonadota bacterium]